MSDSPLPPRLYDEKEVNRLLKRATELQREEPSGVVHHGGLSLRDLEEIGQEAGIDARHLRRAAMELDSEAIDPSIWTRLLGDSPALSAQATVPGELPRDAFETLIPPIQQVMREHGQPSLLGHTLTWQAESGQNERSIQIVVSSRGGETHIRAEERLHRLAGAIFGGGVGGAGVGIGVGVGLNVGLEVLHSVLFSVAFPIGVLGLAFIGTREAFRRFTSRRRRILTEVVERLASEVSRLVGESTLEGGQRPPELPRG